MFVIRMTQYHVSEYMCYVTLVAQELYTNHGKVDWRGAIQRKNARAFVQFAPSVKSSDLQKHVLIQRSSATLFVVRIAACMIPTFISVKTN